MKRKLKIYEQSMGGGNYTPVPTLLLKGKWLEEVGFKAGEYVEINVENEVITIKKTTPPEVKKKESLEEKVKKLDKKQRDKLASIIDKL
ncbi:MAG: type I addiction module toxin, SymE family [Clostridiales bacterium]|nr:type I addiction module toxin, SymE family [Clostridiales bacterium]